MYEEYWKLDRKPFDNTSDRNFFFPAESHQGALLKLRYAVENRRGAALLTGAAGLGKTMMVTRLFESLDSEIEPRVHAVFPRMETDELVAFLGNAISGQNMPNLSISDSVRSVQDFLESNTENGQHALVVVDEAHLLANRETLETLRLLLNFQSKDGYDLTLILVGQPQVIANVQRAAGLDERMTVKCLLRPLSALDTASYINHRVTVAGGSTSLFTDKALDEVYRQTFGVPGRINKLCDLALLIGYAEEHESIGEEQVRSVAREIIAIGDEAAA